MPRQKRIDISGLDFKPIPGEDDYSVTPILDEGKFRRQTDVGPYDMDASGFFVAGQNDLGALGAEDTSHFIRVGLSQILIPAWAQLQPIVEMYRRIELMLKASGMGLELTSGFEGSLPKVRWTARASQLRTVRAKPFFWRSTYAWANEPTAMGFLGEDAEVVASPVDVAAIAKSSALKVIPAIGTVLLAVKLLGDGVKSRRQAKAGPHIEKWLGWLNIEGLITVISEATAAFVEAGGELPAEGVLPPAGYLWIEFNGKAQAKWLSLGSTWEATPNVYTVDMLHEKLKASIVPLRKLADARSGSRAVVEASAKAALDAAAKAAAIARAKAFTAARAAVRPEVGIMPVVRRQPPVQVIPSPSNRVNAIGGIVSSLIAKGVLTNAEAAPAIAALNKLTTGETLTAEERVIVDKISPSVAKSSIWAKLIPAAGAAAMFIL